MIALTDTVAEVAGVERDFLGKDSAVRQSLKLLGKLDAESRNTLSASLNGLRNRMEAAIKERRRETTAREAQHRLSIEWIDRSMPALGRSSGLINPVTLIEERAIHILRQLGFEIQEGPEVETEYFCFDSLNIPKYHPARDMQDTFFIEGGYVLRTHTTSVQARVLSRRPSPPLRVISRGRVYRNEDVDATHLAMFHQLEGVVLDPHASLAQLKWVLRFVAEGLFGPTAVIRFKPKYYPYTLPSIGMDLQCTTCEGLGCPACHEAGWLTVIGAGMIHPKVLSEFGYDPARVSGFAFGWGTTRLAAQLINLPEVRAMYQTDMRFLRSLSEGR